MPDHPSNRFPLWQVGVVVGLLGLLAAVVVPAILAAREASRRSYCVNNLKQLSLGVANYADTYKRIPLGTYGSRSLSPGERFSWYLPVWTFFQGKPPTVLIDENQAWDADVNRAPRIRRVVDWGQPTERTEIRPLPFITLFSCPSGSRTETVLGLQVTHYIGMAGLGARSPEFDRDQQGAGVWGYDRQVAWADVEDGASSTILLAETSRDLGPWIAGGHPTVRGFDPEAAPQFGNGGQFGGIHSTILTAMADGSIKEWNNATDAAIFAAMVTIAGGD